MGKTLTVVGDIRVELRSRLTATAFRDIDSSHFEFTPVTPVIAGTAANLARHAIGHFDRVHVISRIGDDAFTPAILRHLERSGVTAHVFVSDRRCNGCTIVVHDAAPEPPGGARLLLAGPTPNASLSPADVRECAGAIAESDMVFVDGYTFVARSSREAVLEAARTARSHQVPVCVDLVPHDISEYLERDEASVLVELADIVVTGATTIAAFVDAPPPTPDSLEMVRRLAAALARHFDPGKLWLVRFGRGDIHQTAMCRAGVVVAHYPTGYAVADDPAGRGDHRTAADLHDLARNAAPVRAAGTATPSLDLCGHTKGS
jgi:sugar/nucleoside kinase (ribokinase family)